MSRVVRRTVVGGLALICALMLVLWGRSYFMSDLLERHRRGDLHGLRYDEIHGSLSSRGAIGLGYVRIDHPPVAGFQERWMYEATRGTPGPWPMLMDVLGFGYWNAT